DYLVPVLAIGVYLGLIMLEKHLSAIAIVASLGFLMLVFGSLKILPLLGIFGGCGVAGGAFYLLKNEYALSRITSFIEGKETMEMTDERFQTLHGLWAIGSGGALGLGLGASRLKNLWVSQAHNDFIFTIWCEETGFVGGAALIIVFGLLIWRGYLIALKAPDTYSTLTALGITTHIALQVVLNLGVVTDILPNTGISLPFISYGGTSLILIMMEMGILLSISKHTVETETVPEGEIA
ncbi:MAG: FtsW/RodA/SpoVE family cell cycle protein, partial [Clostridia bacterium]|nr:FtsW/RodA/SpoVE family cell cycle protein [Clostridia bacterium]